MSRLNNTICSGDGDGSGDGSAGDAHDPAVANPLE